MSKLISSQDELEPFMALAYKEAQKSPDPSTQNGAVILDPRYISRYYPGGGFIIEAVGHNDFVPGVEPLPKRFERPQKYFFIEHAERNAIYNAVNMGVDLEGAILVSPWAACADCARAIIHVGITVVVCHWEFSSASNERWGDSIAAGHSMFEEARVEVVWWRGRITKNDPSEYTVRRDGQLWTP